MSPKRSHLGKGTIAKAKAGQDARTAAKDKTDNEAVLADFLSLPPRSCGSCGQSTHDYERDLPGAETRAKWLKKDYSVRLQKWSPQGCECYYCNDERRACLKDEDGNVPSQADVEKKKKENPEYEAWCLQLRASKVNGDKVAVSKAVKQPPKLQVETKEGTFEEAYEKGRFLPLQAFAKIRNIKYSKVGELSKYIETALKMDVGMGKFGKTRCLLC